MSIIKRICAWWRNDASSTLSTPSANEIRPQTYRYPMDNIINNSPQTLSITKSSGHNYLVPLLRTVVKEDDTSTSSALEDLAVAEVIESSISSDSESSDDSPSSDSSSSNDSFGGGGDFSGGGSGGDW